MDPEQIKEVFNKFQDFEKPKLSVHIIEPHFQIVRYWTCKFRRGEMEDASKDYQPCFPFRKTEGYTYST